LPAVGFVKVCEGRQVFFKVLQQEGMIGALVPAQDSVQLGSQVSVL
jgi:hypothetical protein